MSFPSYSGTLLWHSDKSRIDEIHTYSIRLEKRTFITGGKARQAVFLTPLNPFGKDPEEEKRHSDYTVLQKAPCETKWKRNQDAVYWVRLKEAQDQRLESWQTKSFAIVIYFTIPGDCIDCVAARDGDRVLFERLATPRPPPKITLKRNWQSQEQQQEQQPEQPTSHTDVPSIWKQRTVQKRTKYRESGSNSLLKWVWILISVTKKSTQMHSWRTKLWKQNWQVRIQKPLKESKLVQILYSRRSGEVEDGVQPTIQPSYLRDGWCGAHWVEDIQDSMPIMPTLRFEKTILCRCEKHIRPDLDMMRRIKAASEALKAPCFRTSAINAKGYKHGPHLWQEHHYKPKDAPDGCSKNKRQKTSIWDRWQNDETYRESQLAIDWSDAWVRYLDHSAKIYISHTVPHMQKNRYNNLLYLRSVDEDKQAPPPQRVAVDLIFFDIYLWVFWAQLKI